MVVNQADNCTCPSVAPRCNQYTPYYRDCVGPCLGITLGFRGGVLDGPCDRDCDRTGPMERLRNFAWLSVLRQSGKVERAMRPVSGLSGPLFVQRA